MSDILELFGQSTSANLDWGAIVAQQACPFLGRKCIKIRKSQPEISIGTCSVTHGRDKRPMLICPFRLLERKQIFLDCMHFHAYRFGEQEGGYNIEMALRLSTGAEGVAACLGLKAEPKVEFTKIVMEVEKKLSPETLVTI